MTRASTCDEAVDVYTSRAAVPHDYYELAWISAEGNSVYTSDGKITDQIKKKAAEVGANAIIVNDFQESGATAKVIGAAVGANSADTKVSALAVYMPAESDRVRLKCGK
jgi:adenine/guanine phosphoribosyltransferase-like PRPP-binding protein